MKQQNDFMNSSLHTPYLALPYTYLIDIPKFNDRSGLLPSNVVEFPPEESLFEDESLDELLGVPKIRQNLNDSSAEPETMVDPSGDFAMCKTLAV